MWYYIIIISKECSKLTKHGKTLNTKQKMAIYISSAVLAIIAAITAVILLIHTVNNPPSIIFNSNGGSYFSVISQSEGSNSSVMFIPQSPVTILPESNDKNIEEIIEIVDKIEQTPQNTVIAPNNTVDTSALTKRSVKLNVKYLPQNPELPTGCEITSLTTVLNYYGFDVSKTEMSDKYLVKTIDKIGNFWEVFVGDPRKNGFGCYAKPIVNAANKYLATQNSRYKAVDYSGTKFENLLTIVESGTPVIIWGTMYDEKENDLRKPFTTVKWNIDGKELQWIAPEHCMVLIGYDADRHIAIMSDPQRGIVEYNLETVKSRYLALHSQCVVFEELPVINGIKNGDFYYTTQYVAVADYDLASVTLNGEEVGTQFLIEGNSTNMYVIEAIDTSGNVITYTVYTKPIASLLEPISHLNEYTVTVDDYDMILDIKNKALALETRYSPPSEGEAIDEIVGFCDRYLTRLDALIKDIEEISNTINEFKENTPLLGDTEAINQLIQKIDALLSSENINADQYKTLQNMKAQCQSWLKNVSPDNQGISNIE
ncbi:MAG: hypothetical protein E7521_01285 [Ruminococcaceae bacterium]|nr:hypothetical protein [Oscillospiraceae bacterium]